MNKGTKTLQLLIAFVFLLSLLGPETLPAALAIAAKAHPLLLELAVVDPRQPVAVIVQKLTKDSRLETWVTEQGGKVTKDLRIINAFAAEMSAGTALELARSPQVRWVSPDGAMQHSALSAFSVADDFRIRNFSGNSGTANWATTWTEIGESDGPNTGRIVVASNYKCAYYNCLVIGKSGSTIDGYGVWRQANLSNVVTATLSFDYRRSVFNDYGGLVHLQVSENGGTSWNTLASYRLDQSDYSQNNVQIDLTAFISVNTQVRFQGVGSVNGYIYIDNFQIAYQLPPVIDYFRATTGAELVESEGLNGQGLSVAVIDSGVASHGDLASRLLASPFGLEDEYGHGTHVSGIIGGDGTAFYGAYKGIAPGVNLVSLKVSDANGMSYESDVVNALQWVYDNRTTYNIRVVNMSLNSTIEDSYHNSPLDAAVEIVWFSGVVVVVSAGNKGPAGSHNTARTAPANDPFVITVGASDEHGNSDYTDDTIAPFSAFGVTVDGFVKPEIIAPGYSIVSDLSPNSPWIITAPDRVVEQVYIRLSGTSMAAPMVSGAVALLLQDEPNLTPDQVKYRLMNGTSRMLSNDGGTFPYLDIYAAVHGTSTQSANTGLVASQLLWTGGDPITWGSVSWNSVSWNSVSWNSVSWNSVSWNSVQLNGIFWERGTGGNLIPPNKHPRPTTGGMP